ncbi:MAG: cbb3-type cytochrome oxidase assembly protein CcoS [Phycisphaerales bacterium]|jgi:cbb3-type cytochrome oxidase maturation protein|nr:cbb3-type cytochrome oxidase assembly protein CcoS [Phycisphaerales bacterium]
MSVLYLVLPLAIVIAGIFVWLFIWSVKSGQMDDLDSPARRIVLDDDYSSSRSARRERAGAQVVESGGHHSASETHSGVHNTAISTPGTAVRLGAGAAVHGHGDTAKRATGGEDGTSQTESHGGGSSWGPSDGDAGGGGSGGGGD